MSKQHGAVHEVVTKTGAEPSLVMRSSSSSERRHIVLRPLPVDRLSTLPPELLKMIFEEIKLSSKKHITGAISSGLTPYTRHNLYHDVEISDMVQFDLLRRTVDQATTSIAPLITSLSLLLGCQDSKAASSASIDTFLATLSNLARLKLEGCDSAHVLACILSFPPKAYLQRLATLHIQNFLRCWKIPYEYDICDIELYAGLENYPALSTLKIETTYGRSHTYMPNVKSPRLYPSFLRNPNNTIQSLYVHVEDEEVNRDLERLPQKFTALKFLHLAAEGSFNFSKALEGVNSGLEKLTLVNSGFYEGCEVVPVDGSLRQFPQLSTLELGSETFSPDIYEDLVNYPSIQTLKFRDEAEFSLRGIETIVSRATRTGHLKFLELGHRQSGTRGCPSPQHLSLLDLLNCGWSRPTWNGSFSYEDGEKLCQLRHKSTIKIFGRIFDAIEVQQEYHEQLQNLVRLA